MAAITPSQRLNRASALALDVASASKTAASEDAVPKMQNLGVLDANMKISDW